MHDFRVVFTDGEKMTVKTDTFERAQHIACTSMQRKVADVWVVIRVPVPTSVSLHIPEVTYAGR